MITLTQTNAFEHFKPLADNIEAHMLKVVRANIARWMEMTGGVYKHYRYNDTSDEAKTYNSCRRYLNSENGSFRVGSKMIIAEDFLKKEAKQLGEDSVLSMVAKIVGKVGDIQFTKLDFRGGANFRMHGHTNGHDVLIDQQTVYKVSNQGTFFCQFPARIYVDSKFTPASKFAEATTKVAA